MNKESAFMNPAWHVPDGRAEEKTIAKAEAEPRQDLFKAAIRRTLLGVLQEKENQEAVKIMSKNLSNYELSLLEKGELPKINMLIDIDGVLIDTDSAFMDIVKTLGQDMHLAKNIKAAARLVGKDKMTFGVKRELLKCRQFTQRMTLVTDRFGAGTRFFPCFNHMDREVFEKEKRGIGVETNMHKFWPMFADGGKFLSQIREGDITYYFGSSVSDKKYFDLIQKAMQAEGVLAKKLVYVHAGAEGAIL